MCMMLCSVPIANVSIQIWCQKLCAAGFSGSPKNSTKLLLYMLSSFELLSSSCTLLTLMVD